MSQITAVSGSVRGKEIDRASDKVDGQLSGSVEVKSIRKSLLVAFPAASRPLLGGTELCRPLLLSSIARTGKPKTFNRIDTANAAKKASQASRSPEPVIFGSREGRSHIVRPEYVSARSPPLPNRVPLLAERRSDLAICVALRVSRCHKPALPFQGRKPSNAKAVKIGRAIAPLPRLKNGPISLHPML